MHDSTVETAQGQTDGEGDASFTGSGIGQRRRPLRHFLLFRWPESIALLAYAAIVAAAIPFHEPWADEAQAWQLARNLSLRELFGTYLRYEGSPGLWHLLLWVLNRAHIGYTGLHWFCGAIALLATALLLFASPFPRFLKLALPFTTFLLYQYAVIARSYVLAPLLLFGIAVFWRRHPLLVALGLGLLANTSLHAAAISAGLAVVYFLERIRNGGRDKAHDRRGLLSCALIIAAFYAFALWTAWPPHDIVRALLPEHSRALIPDAIASLVRAVCWPWELSIFFWIAIAALFAARSRFFYLLPVVCFALFSGRIYARWWHAGLLIPLLLCLLWISWPEPGAAISRRESFGRIALAVMIATQIAWAGYALYYDHFFPYSPDLAAAEFLRPLVARGDKVIVTAIDDEGNGAFDDVGILPYFDQNIYANQANAFWWWSSDDLTELRFEQMLPTHPRFVLVEIRNKSFSNQIDLSAPKFLAVERAGYRFAHAWCGTFPEGFQLTEPECHVLFESTRGALEPATPPVVVPANR